MPPTDQRPEPTTNHDAARRSRALGVAVALAVALVLVVLAVVIRRHGAPTALANSPLGAPIVRLFNAIREHVYFARDEHCLRQLAMANVGFQFVAAPQRRDACPLRNVVRVLPTHLLRRPLYMTCRLARALDRWDREVLQPAAQQRFGQPVAQLIENGVRNCRPVAGYRSLLSEHAFANAIDVEGFVLGDGRTIDVAGDRNGDDARGQFLREVAARGCDVFRTVLGPGFDASHGRHLHLDMGLLGGCRP
jgi:hypothetical protein